MVKINMRGFRPLEFKTNGLLIKQGGLLKTECPLHTKEVAHNGVAGVATFVHIKTREPWLTQAVVGKSHRGEMFEGVLTDLYNEVVALETHIRAGTPDPIPGLDGRGGRDPMDEMGLELEELEEEPRRKFHKKKGWCSGHRSADSKCGSGPRRPPLQALAMRCGASPSS